MTIHQVPVDERNPWVHTLVAGDESRRKTFNDLNQRPSAPWRLSLEIREVRIDSALLDVGQSDADRRPRDETVDASARRVRIVSAATSSDPPAAEHR